MRPALAIVGAAAAVAMPAFAASDAEIDRVLAARGVTGDAAARRQIGCILDGLTRRAGPASSAAWLDYNDMAHDPAIDAAARHAGDEAFRFEWGAIFDAAALDCFGGGE